METRETFESDGKSIMVERFEPHGFSKVPVVVIVHGADGMALGGFLYQEFGRQLARNGFVAVFPHYFEKTGTQSADPLSTLAFFIPWSKTVQDTVTYAAKQSSVDPKAVGLVGFSLGATISVGVGSQDKRVDAVVEFCGGPPAFGRYDSMPPTLILHGEKDTIVSIQEAYKLQKLLKEAQRPCELKVYPNQGHIFLGDDAKDAIERAIGFFTATLKK